MIAENDGSDVEKGKDGWGQRVRMTASLTMTERRKQRQVEGVSDRFSDTTEIWIQPEWIGQLWNNDMIRGKCSSGMRCLQNSMRLKRVRNRMEKELKRARKIDD